MERREGEGSKKSKEELVRLAGETEEWKEQEERKTDEKNQRVRGKAEWGRLD